MLRAGRDSEHVDEFIAKNIVALGWSKTGEIPPGTAKEKLLKVLEQKYPDAKPATRMTWAAQLLRFVNELQVGDAVVTYDSNQRTYFLGTVASPPEWSTEFEAGHHVRRMKWTAQVPRDNLGVATRNTLGAIQTLFKLNSDAWADLEKHQVPLGSVPPAAEHPVDAAPARETEAETVQLRDETVQKAIEFIEDALSRLSWDDMQELVAGLLRAMGYITKVSPPGPDRGVDIFASPDGLGLQEPRIFVEVKHRDGSMGAKEIRAFLGGRKQGDRCLFVSSGGFSKDARYEAERSHIPLTLLNLAEIRKLLLDHYDKLDAEARDLIPLRKIYWPA